MIASSWKVLIQWREMIDLPPAHLNTLRSILARHVPECEVRVFGSRANGTAKPYSDIDLALVGPARLGGEQLRLLKEELEESDLPMRVDVLDWAGISSSFQQVIARKYEIIQAPTVSI